jgi:hypothetical protein
MAERRQPDYDFFGPGQGRPPTGQPPAGPPPYGAHPPYGAPPPPPPPPGPPYGTATHSFGGPPPPPHGAAWQQVRPAPYPVAPRSRAVTALIAAAVVLVSIIGIGVVSAVAIPVFLSQRMKAEWRSTTIALPATFDGGTRTDVPSSAIPQVPDDVIEPLQVAGYRTGDGATLVVGLTKARRPMTDQDQAEARRGVVAGMAMRDVQLTLTESDPGQLGGWFGCGAVTGNPATACVATDHAGIVMIVVAGSDAPVADARRLREASVHR